MAPATSQTTETHPKPFDASTTSSPTASSCCSVLPLSPITSSASSSSRVLAVPSRTFTHPDNQEPQATSIMSVAEPLVLPDGRFGCPKCPRCSFNTLAKATKHVHFYQHTYVCSAQGCTWSYDTYKDLQRHRRRHNPRVQKYTCPFSECISHQRLRRTTFSRQDLLKRHVETFHGETLSK